MVNSALWSASTVLLVGWLAGCATGPELPGDFRLANSRIAPLATETQIVLDGPSGKGSGAAGGAAKGGGVGLAVGSLGCLAAGPLAALCLAVVVPSTVVVGAASGAVVGAVKAEDAADVDGKRAMLRASLTASAVHARFDGEVRRLAALRSGPTTAAMPTWSVALALTDVATVGSGPDKPFALQVGARVVVHRHGEAEPVFQKDYRSPDSASRVTSEWRREDHAPLRAALIELVDGLAKTVVDDLPP